MSDMCSFPPPKFILKPQRILMERVRWYSTVVFKARASFSESVEFLVKNADSGPVILILCGRGSRIHVFNKLPRDSRTQEILDNLTDNGDKILKFTLPLDNTSLF